VENETQTLYDLENGKKTDKEENDIQIVGHEIWRETVKNA
jgi:hypothetical protein